MAVDERRRGLRIGKRLYEARRTLAERLELKGIVFGGRMPGFRRARRRADGPEDYIEKVREGKLRDPVIGFQFANGFAPIGVLADYLPDDQASCGFRSEEHTSELQSLMRITYDVVCLKKKKKKEG